MFFHLLAKLKSLKRKNRMSLRHLKIKVKSLAAEARIIKHEERKTRGLERRELQDHRKGVVRREARHSGLALGYLRGRAYRAMEATCRTAPDWSAVERMIKRYGPPRHNMSFEDWRKNEQTESIRSSAA